MTSAVLGLVCAFCWGVHDFLAGISSRSIGQLRTTVGVTIVGLAAISVWMAATQAIPLGLIATGPGAMLSGVFIVLATLWLFAAMATGPVSLALPIVMSYPATAFGIRALLGSPPGFLQVIAAAIVLAGVLVVAASEDGAGDHRPATRGSILYAVMSHGSFAAGTMLGQHYAPLLGTLETTWLQRLGGAAVIVAFWLISRQPKTVPMRFAPMLVAMGLLDITAIGMLNHAGNLPHPEIAIVGGSSAVLVTVVLARIFLKERIVALRWAGIAVSFAGVAVLSLTAG